MDVEEPNSAPRLRFHLDDGSCVKVDNVDTGESFHGAAASSAYAAKIGRDRIALSALGIITDHIPDYAERRLDVGDLVVFGLPSSLADEFGEAVSFDLVESMLDEIADGRLMIVWADG